MGVKSIPSLGVMTPLESLAKGGSAKELFNPMNITNDFMGVLRKPSSLLNKETLTGQGEDTERSRSVVSDEEDEAKAKELNRRNNANLNWTQSRGTGLRV